jgi:hypothetical protein
MPGFLKIAIEWLHIATNAPWYFSNREISEDLENSFFAYYVRAVPKSFG